MERNVISVIELLKEKFREDMKFELALPQITGTKSSINQKLRTTLELGVVMFFNERISKSNTTHDDNKTRT